MKISYEWLVDYVGKDIPAVGDVTELLTNHAFEIEEVETVEEQSVIDVKVLPDRGSDALSHRGIARELSTIIGTPLVYDPLAQHLEFEVSNDFEIEIENKEDCRRFMVALIENIKVGPSPLWLQERLQAIGQRSINNIVDATNYVMYAVGQPLHAYDAVLFAKNAEGKWNFLIRKAKVGEEISLLKEKGSNEDRVVKLTGEELLIVDGSNNTPIGLAGVKGGAHASLHAGSSTIIIEAANFHPGLTRQTARRLNIVTDAGKRFENNPSPELPPYALAEIIKLITDIAGGHLVGVTDSGLHLLAKKPIILRAEKIKEALHLDLTTNEIEDILNRLGAKFKPVAGGWEVEGPWERTDLVIEASYIDEVGRLYGLAKITSIKPEEKVVTEVNKNQYYSELVRDLLTKEGFSEVITSTFRNKDIIQLKNALATDKSYLRSALRPALRNSLLTNAQHMDVLGLSQVAIFEIGTVFTRTEDGLAEHLSLALGVRNKKTGISKEDDKILISTLITLANAGIVLDGSEIAEGLIEVNLSKLIETLPVPKTYTAFTAGPAISYKPFSVYPALARDIALWVDETVSVEEVERVINEASGPLRVTTTLFDEFHKEGKVSYAFRIVLQAFDRTLMDADADAVMEKVNTAVSKAGYIVR